MVVEPWNAGASLSEPDTVVGNGTVVSDRHVHVPASRDCNTYLETPDVVRPPRTDIEKHGICKSPRERDAMAGRVRFASWLLTLLASRDTAKNRRGPLRENGDPPGSRYREDRSKEKAGS